MSSFAVKVERVVAVEPHHNADRLDVIQVLDWRCVVQKGAFKPGDLCVYFPIDSILPEHVESAIFGPDAKVKLSKSRVKTIKLRGEISQGLAVLPRTLGFYLPEDGRTTYEGADVTQALGVTKYEPPVSEMPAGMSGKSAKSSNPNFPKYTDLDNAKNHPDIFREGEMVILTEKIHGTNFRAGYVRAECNTLWKKLKRFLGFMPDYEFVYGSRNVQMQDRIGGGKTWLQKNSHANVSENVYAEAVRKYNLRAVLKPGEVVYGEIYGDGIQKGYNYGCGPGERKLVLFDVMKDGRYLNFEEFRDVVARIKVPRVPVVQTMAFDAEWIKGQTKGSSILDGRQAVREGVVVKPLQEQQCRIGRKILKFISDDYLLKDQTDFH